MSCVRCWTWPRRGLPTGRWSRRHQLVFRVSPGTDGVLCGLSVCRAARPCNPNASPTQVRPIWHAAPGLIGWTSGEEDDPLIFAVDVEAIGRVLRAGRSMCPSCGGRLRAWTSARTRRVDAQDGRSVPVTPDRGRCRGCDVTHVVLPAWYVPRRASRSTSSAAS
jgi:Domain of unknown function (DUF6431)